MSVRGSVHFLTARVLAVPLETVLPFAGDFLVAAEGTRHKALDCRSR